MGKDFGPHSKAGEGARASNTLPSPSPAAELWEAKSRIVKLEAELQAAKDRIEELEKALGWDLIDSFRVGFNLSKTEARFLLALFSRTEVSHESMYIFMYNDHDADHRPENQLMQIFASKVRKKLTPLGIEFETKWGWGYRMDMSTKKKVVEYLADQGYVIE